MDKDIDQCGAGYRAIPVGVWVDVNILKDKEPCFNSDRNRFVFRTKKKKTFVTQRNVDEWLIDKYQLDKFIILPE